MILPLLISMSAFACQGSELVPLVLPPTKSYNLIVDRAQEIILDGGKITAIKGTTPKGKPMLTVMSGLQVLEGGKMKSYPNRISIKMNETEKDWDRPIEVAFAGAEKTYILSVRWSQIKTGCANPIVK